MAIKLGTSNNDTLFGTVGFDIFAPTRNEANNQKSISHYHNNILTAVEHKAATAINSSSYKYLTFNDMADQSILSPYVITPLDFSAISDAKFIGNAPFSGVAGEIRYQNDDYYYSDYSTTYISADIDGDGKEDAVLKVFGRFNFVETYPGSKVLMIARNQTLESRESPETLTGGAGNDTLIGGEWNDTLIGGNGSDSLLGSDGDDVLNGGPSFDFLTGGNGADRFVFSSIDDFVLIKGYYQNEGINDSISDFSPNDMLVLNYPNARFIGNANFTGTPGEYRYYNDWMNTYKTSVKIQFNFDGDSYSIIDAEITLNNVSLLSVFQETFPGSNILVMLPNVTLKGTTANDILTGGGGSDTLSGDLGNDSLSGAAGRDLLNGGDGADTLMGGLGVDTLTGGAGYDVFKYTAINEISTTWHSFPGEVDLGAEIITDFAVGDLLDLSAIAGLSFVGLGYDFTGVANQIRADYNRILIDTDGDKQADYRLSLSSNLFTPVVIEETFLGSNIFQYVVDQIITGTSLNDRLITGNGNDSVYAGAGNDYISTGYGNDTINAGDGADTLIGGLGVDSLMGGPGNDTFVYTALADFKGGFEAITDFELGDKLDLSAIPGLTFAGVGHRLSGVANQISISISNGFVIDTNGDKTPDYSLSISTLEETAPNSLVFQIPSNKIISGNANNNFLQGGNGDDSLSGNGGNDVLVGNYGNDTLNGGLGSDTLTGGLGNDVLTGGLGNDVFKYNSIEALTSPYEDQNIGEKITDFSLGDKLDLSGIPGITLMDTNLITLPYFNRWYSEWQFNINGKGNGYRIALSNHISLLEETAVGSHIFQIPENKTFIGLSTKDTLIGGNGNDRLLGNAGADSLFGGYGNDTLNGGLGPDTLEGGTGVDLLLGGIDNDYLIGDYESDTLNGGLGSDTLEGGLVSIGGLGNDVFRYSTETLGYIDKIIADFSPGDKIDLSAIDADWSHEGKQTFSFIGSQNFTGYGGELRYENGKLEGDIAYYDHISFSISLTGSPTLTASDFIL